MLTFEPIVVMQEGSSIWNKNAEHKDSEGLMVKILKVLINEPAESLYRYVFLHNLGDMTPNECIYVLAVDIESITL